MKDVEYMDLVMCPYISADWVPQSATCLGCHHKAWRHLLVTSGSRHNQGGNYCWLCGKKFVSMIGEMNEYKQVLRRWSVNNEQARISLS